MTLTRDTTTRLRLGLLAAILVAVLALGYEVRHARALGIPTLTTLAYTGSLLTFGSPDNSTHIITLAVFVAGANDGGLGSAACTTGPTTVTCVNGQFSIPLSASCEAVIQQNPNVQTEVNIDGTAMGLVAVSAVPYAIEAGTATGIPVVPAVPDSPAVGTIVYNSAILSMQVWDGTVWRLFPSAGPTSCNQILASGQSTGSGIYTINPTGAAAYQVYCDMTTAGGGWTVFYAGTNGSPNDFAQFENTALDCPNPQTQCLRRLPQNTPSSISIAAVCGSAILSFSPTAGLLNYLENGVQDAWQSLTNVTVISGGATAVYATNMWTGAPSNNGWILTEGNGNQTFADSYNANASWDYCNGSSNSSSAIRLQYR